MNLTAKKIADILDGVIEGDQDVLVSDISPIENSQSGGLTFLANPKYEKYLYSTKASVVIVSDDTVLKQPVKITLIRVKDPYTALGRVMSVLQKEREVVKNGREMPHYVGEKTTIGKNEYIGAYAYLANNVTIGDNCKIYPHVYIGDNVTIGNNVTLYSGVKIYHDCIIGDSCIIHSNSVIGADGFGFAPKKDGTYEKIPQLGNVVIEDDVEIGACATIDRATFFSTIIRRGVKLDDQVLVAHNSSIGENSVLAGQVGIAGSTHLGKNNVLAGQVGIAGHVNIGDNNQFAAQTGVASDVQNNQVLRGTPPLPLTEYARSMILFRKLPELLKKIR